MWQAGASVRMPYGRDMRIVVSGTHASGKSTLVSDFALRHPEFAVLPDPFELLDETWDGPTASSFSAQLRVSAERLDPLEAPDDLIAERGPIDFLAYLLALSELGAETVARHLLARSVEITRAALSHVDVLVVLPLTAADAIEPGTDEHPELREAMNDNLLDLIDSADVLDPWVSVVEITGDRERRLAALESLATGKTDRRSGSARLG